MSVSKLVRKLAGYDSDDDWADIQQYGPEAVTDYYDEINHYDCDEPGGTNYYDEPSNPDEPGMPIIPPIIPPYIPPQKPTVPPPALVDLIDPLTVSSMYEYKNQESLEAHIQEVQKINDPRVADYIKCLTDWFNDLEIQRRRPHIHPLQRYPRP